MLNLECNKSAKQFVEYFGKDSKVFAANELNDNEIKKVLSSILLDIDTNILKKKYSSFIDAKQSVAHDANQLINLVKMFNVYLTQCKKSQYTKLLKKQMCKNIKIICNTYHLMHIWSLLVVGCLHFQTAISSIDYSTLVNVKIDMIKSDDCVKNLQHKNNLELAKQLLKCSHHLRQNMNKYCSFPMDHSHRRFISSVRKTITLLEQHS